jgi:cell division septation protein DedD
LFFALRAPIVDVQAKDRLTGAVILVAMLVLLVPEILSGPAHSSSAVADQGSGETALRSYSVDLGEVQRAPAADSASAPVAATSPGEGSAGAEAHTPALAAPAAPRSQAETPAPPATQTGPAAATQAPAAVTARPAPLRPVAVAAKPPAPAVRGAWTVQLGTFSSQANADRLVHELQGKGFAAFSTESSSGGRKLYRVRVGPASDHAGAAALAVRLRSAGHSGSLTEHP